MAIINMHDAKTQLSDLVARAEAGEEIVIARRNKPAVRLVAVGANSKPSARKSREQAFGSMAYLRDALKDVDWFEPLPENELQAWEGKYSSDP
jgi:prevent-host-death family protein